MHKRIKRNLWSNVKNSQVVIVLANIHNSLWKVNSHMYKHSSALWESCRGRAYCIDSIAGGCVYFQFKTMRQTTGCVSEMRISIRSGRCMRNGKQECDSEKSSLLLLKFLNFHVDPDQEGPFWVCPFPLSPQQAQHSKLGPSGTEKPPSRYTETAFVEGLSGAADSQWSMQKKMALTINNNGSYISIRNEFVLLQLD